MIYKIFTYVAMAVVFTACSKSAKSGHEEKEGIVLSGKIEKPQEQGYIVLEEIGNNSTQVVDTIRLASDSSFSLQLVKPEPGFYRLNLYNKQFVNLILSDEDVQVKVDGSSQSGKAEVSGSTDTEYFNKVNAVVEQFQTKVNGLNSDYVSAKSANDTQKANEIEEKFLSIQADNSQKIKAEIRKMDGSIAALYAVNFLNPEEEFVFMDSLANQLSEDLPKSSLVQEFVQQIDNQRNLAVGQMAPEISLPNPEGEIVKLSSLRGQYVLIDFWAEWCGPCRRENPNVVKVYNKYHDKGFEIYGVSLDRDKNKWLKAIAQDKLSWVHVSDLKYWDSDVVPLYSIKGIPFTVLIDKEGRIIAKNLRGKALEDKLEEIFENS